MSFLAYAEAADGSGYGMMVWLVFAGVAAGVYGMGFVVAGLAWKRNHRQAEFLVGAAVLWALATGGSVVWAVMAQMNWATEHATLLNTGYLDPSDVSGKPAWPVGLWIVLGVVYGGLVGFAMSQRNLRES